MSGSPDDTNKTGAEVEDLAVQANRKQLEMDVLKSLLLNNKDLLKDIMKEVSDDSSSNVVSESKHEKTINPLEIQQFDNPSSANNNDTKSDNIEERAKNKAKENMLYSFVNSYYLPDNITGPDRKRFISYYVDLIRNEYNTRKSDRRFGYMENPKMFFSGLVFSTLPMPKLVNFENKQVLELFKGIILNSPLAAELQQALEYKPQMS